MNNLFIIGYGYLAKKLLTVVLKENIAIYTFSRHEVIPESSLHQHRVIDLDNQSHHFSSIDIPQQPIIIYLVPPPAKGKKDLRMANFLQALNFADIVPKKIILISTTGVYGDHKGQWVSEESELKPQADRAHRRLNAEQQASQFCQQFQVNYTILRVAGFYALDKLPLARIKSAQPIINEAEAPYSNRLHADDLVNICYHAIFHDYLGIYNCSDSKPSNMTDYFTQLALAFNLPIPPLIPLSHARRNLSAGMNSYLKESRRISNKKLLQTFKLTLAYPSLESFIREIRKTPYNFTLKLYTQST